MDGHIVGSMISANSITGEQIQANSIKTANLELSVQKKIQDATNEETVKALIKADLDGFESTLSKEFITVENATTQIQQATEVAVKEATQSIVNNAVTESMGAVDGQLNDKLNQYTNGILLPIVVEKAEEVLQDAENYVVTKLDSYATKSELKSSISQTRDQIELSVSEKYTTKSESATIITEAVDGITVGAINRVLGTGESKSFKFNGGANETWLPYKFSNDISNKEVYVSFKYTLTGTAQNGSQIEFAPSYLKKANNQTVYQPKNIFFASDRLQDVNISDTLSFVTRGFKDISPSSSSYIRFVGNGFTGTLSISELQIKPGNSKTSWSPAPEDTIADINDAKADAIASANNALITTIANYYTKEETESAIRVAKEEIDLGVSTKYETKGNVETKISSAKNQLNTEINKKANTTDVYFKTEVYTKDETNSRINIAKENITLAVSQDYETKTSVETKISSTLNSAKSYADTKKTEAINSAASDATSKVNSAKNELNTAIGKKANITDVYNKTEVYTKTEADSRITIAKEEINLGVKNTYETKANVETKINSIQVGSRNWVQNSAFKSTAGWTLSGSWSVNSSEKFRNNNSVRSNRSGLTADSWSELRSNKISVKKGDKLVGSWYIKHRDCDMESVVELWGYKADGSGRVSVANSYKLSGTNTNWTRYILKGTVPANVDYVQLAISHRRNGIIYAAMPQVEYGNTATDWSPAPEDTITDISNAKNEAISSAATDAANKANNAKNEAINSANATLTSTIANYYTKSQTDSQINVAKDSINLGVSQTYETKTNVETKINTAVNKVQVGGRNLWRFTKEYDGTKYNGWVDNNNGAPQAVAPYTTVNGFGVQRIAGAWNDISQRVAIEANTNYTLSAWIKWESTAGSMMFYTNTGTMGGTDVTSQVGTTDYKRVSITFNSGNATVSTCRFECNSNTPYLIYGLKLEKGTKATDWTPAPEDIDSAIGKKANSADVYKKTEVYTKNETNSQITTAKNEINQSVSNTYETKTNVTTKINGVNNSISSLTTRMTNAESKITDTAITNTVKQNFYTKEETNNQITSKGYQTASQVQQTVDSLQIKFTESGGYNLLRNGGFENGMTFWSTNLNPEIIENQSWQNYNGKSIFIRATAGGCGIYQIFPTTPGKTYSYSFYARAENASWLAGVEHRHTQNVEVSPTGWRRYTGTFTATSNTHAFICYAHGSGRNVFLDDVIVCEGSIPLPYSPNPNEIYDGITTIDKDGINVATSYGAHTQFHAGGMSSYNNSNQRTLGIENGGISFHSWNNNALGAYITQSSLWGGNQSSNGLAISTTANGTYLALGTSSLSDVNTTLNMDQALTISASDGFQPRGINFWKDVHAHGYGIRQLSHLKLAGSGAIQFDYLHNSPSTIYEAVDNGHSLYVMGGYQMHLGVMEGSGSPHAVIWMRGKTDTHSYTHWDFHNYTMYNMKTASTYANYNTRRIGESYGVTSNVDGVRYVYRDVELVNGRAIRSIPLEYKGCEYDIVSIVCKGRGNAWVQDEDVDKFVIEGDCQSVNIEIIIHEIEQNLHTVALDEAYMEPLSQKIEPEIPTVITNVSPDTL